MDLVETQLEPNNRAGGPVCTRAAPTENGRPAADLWSTIRLHGEISDVLRKAFYDQLESAPVDGPLVVELFTRGGDADIGRLIACELKLVQEYRGRQVIFKGRSTVYSAGVTIMAAVPRADRYLSRDASIMIHGRQLESTLSLSGSIRSSLPNVRSLLAQMETALEIERQDFCDLAEGSNLTGEDIWTRAEHNWYLTAQEALDFGLVNGLF